MKRCMLFLSLFGMVNAIAAVSPESKQVEIVTPGGTVFCSTYISSIHTTFIGRCYDDEVMVGVRQTDPLQILCGKINVRCSNQEAQKSE